MKVVLASLALAAPLLLALGCGNRAVDDRIAALGPEAANVPTSEHHRPGQPCLLCHGEYLQEEPVMSVGGTIYAFPVGEGQAALPVKDVTVTLIDSFGDTHSVKTNCAGNFYIRADAWDPAYPMRAELEYPVPGSPESTKRVVMSTRISRDGSCAGCHAGAPNQGSPGRVTCADVQPEIPFPPQESSCPGAAK
jgi:hypothetical protein